MAEQMTRDTKRYVLYLSLLLGLALVLVHAVRSGSQYAYVHILDVGQGDAIFIELPEGTQILVDGGPDAGVLAELSEIMHPLDRSIDVVIATHADADHIGGLVDVLARYDVSYVVDTGIEKDTGLFRAWAQAVLDEGAELILADEPKDLRFGDLATLRILWPHEHLLGATPDHHNDYSVVTQFIFGETEMLLTGDIELWSEQRLVDSGVLSDIDILKVPHHGSKTSTSAALLDATMPELAVISLGRDNRFGHPHESVLERLAQRNIPVWRTDTEGRLTIRTNGAAHEIY